MYLWLPICATKDKENSKFCDCGSHFCKIISLSLHRAKNFTTQESTEWSIKLESYFLRELSS